MAYDKPLSKAPFTQGCDLRATFERPEKWPRLSVVTLTQKVLFLCNCCSTTPVPSLNDQSCCNGTTGRAKVSEWRQNHIPRWLKGCHGRRMEVQWSPLWSLNGCYWSAKGGTMVVQRRQNGFSNWYTMFTTVCIFYGVTNGQPLCIHSATSVMCVPSSCLLWATCERPTSSATFVRLFWTCSKLHGDHGIHGDVWTSWVPPLNDQGNRSASFLAFNGDLASFVVAQWRQKGCSSCVKGV